MKTLVSQVTQSPMNAKRWLLSLQCGHERWVTANRKPQRKAITCHDCEREKKLEVKP